MPGKTKPVEIRNPAITPGGVPTSPWHFYTDQDPVTGLAWMDFYVTFSSTSKVLTDLLLDGGGVTFRGANCPFSKIYVGALNSDGTPGLTCLTIPIPLGTRAHTQVQMAAYGLNTVADIINLGQITADY